MFEKDKNVFVEFLERIPLIGDCYRQDGECVNFEYERGLDFGKISFCFTNNVNVSIRVCTDDVINLHKYFKGILRTSKK